MPGSGGQGKWDRSKGKPLQIQEEVSSFQLFLSVLDGVNFGKFNTVDCQFPFTVTDFFILIENKLFAVLTPSIALISLHAS